VTYSGVLVQFIGPPLTVLALWALFDGRRGRVTGGGLRAQWAWRVLAAHVALALLYTTPWDNYLVATGVWWYEPALVTGVTLGYVPLEEYVFFVVQTLMVGLWLLTLSRVIFVAPVQSEASGRVRAWATGVTGGVWLAAVALLLTGWRPGTYLGLELAWGLVPLMIQFAFGADILWRRRGLLLATFLPAALYLCAVDAIAIRSGTWTIDPQQSIGLLIAGVLPVEEVIFFSLTTALVVCGMTLMLAPESLPRAQAWWKAALAPWRRRRAYHDCP
jgi:lycopene cyclase domain-containing protein